MQRRALILAHEGHQGVVRTKARLREKVWWARMYKDVDAFVRECYPCQLVDATEARADQVDATTTGTLGRNRDRSM